MNGESTNKNSKSIERFSLKRDQTTKKLIHQQKHKGKAAYSLVSVTLAVRNWNQTLLQFAAYHL